MTDEEGTSPADLIKNNIPTEHFFLLKEAIGTTPISIIAGWSADDDTYAAHCAEKRSDGTFTIGNLLVTTEQYQEIMSELERTFGITSVGGLYSQDDPDLQEHVRAGIRRTF